MDPQYLDWYFVQLTHELEAGRDSPLRREPLSAAREKRRRLRPAISEVAVVPRNVRFWATRLRRNLISKQ